MSHPVDYLIHTHRLLRDSSNSADVIARSFVYHAIDSYSHLFPRVAARVGDADEAYFYGEAGTTGLPLGLLDARVEGPAPGGNLINYSMDGFKIFCSIDSGRYFITIEDEIYDLNDDMIIRCRSDGSPWFLVYGTTAFSLTSTGMKRRRLDAAS